MLVVNDLDSTDKDTVLNKASELDNATKILASATVVHHNKQYNLFHH